ASPDPPAAGGTSAYPGHGSIAAPATAASFAAGGGGFVSATATWTGTSTLELEISCPDGVSVTRTGTAGLSVQVEDTHNSAACTVTLSLPSGLHADVSYTLVVDPAP
ncbi:MAG TPA: hypothetical protein VKR78_02660, partial [Acidimicrobiales bacterium]|nr:hypothetical protein [Acidimicrobiales bacterium]